MQRTRTGHAGDERLQLEDQWTKRSCDAAGNEANYLGLSNTEIKYSNAASTSLALGKEPNAQRRLLTRIPTMSVHTVGRSAAGGPGIEPRWARGAKVAIGAAYSIASRVWYTLDFGCCITEVYYPTIASPRIRDLQFLVSDPLAFGRPPAGRFF